jgi:hypothetical protein
MAADPYPTFSPDLPRWLRWGGLGLVCLLLLIPAGRILHRLPIYGDDHSSHLATIHYLLTLIRGGKTDLFCPTFNLGFPLYLYYQPLPHLTSALLHLLSFGLINELLAFNLTVVFLWGVFPITTYLGARRLGLGDTAALLAGAMAPLVSSTFPFGFALHSFMGLGLYTQLYAMVLFPLGVGWTWHALHRSDGRGPGPVVAAGGLLVLIWLSHAFYGVAAGTIAVLMVLVVPGRFRQSVPRLLAMGVITVGSLLFWFIPLAQTQAYAGGWPPWEGTDRWDGYGAARVITALMRGHILDEHQLPILSLALLAGVAVALWRIRTSPALRGLLIGFGLFLFFFMGRRTFGALVDIQPANQGLELFRYIGLVHFYGVLLGAVGLAWLAGLLLPAFKPLATLALLGSILFPPTVSQLSRGRHLFQHLDSTRHLAEAGRAIQTALQRGAPPGRIYAHGKTGEGSHLVAALQALHTDQPLGQSYGVSYHDTLGFYYLEHLDPLDASMLALYNFRYVLATPSCPFSRQQAERRNAPLLRRDDLLLFALPGTHGYFAPVDITFAVVGRPREIRPASLQWLSSDLPAAAQHGVVVSGTDAVPEGIHTVLRGRDTEVETLDHGRWVPLRRPWRAAAGNGPPGRVLAESTHLNQYSARVSLARSAAVVLKVAAHPFWEVRVDGHPASRLVLTPSFLGVRLPAGTHEVSFRFRNPTYQKILFLGSLLAWLAWPLCRWRRRRSTPQRPLSPR